MNVVESDDPDKPAVESNCPGAVLAAVPAALDPGVHEADRVFTFVWDRDGHPPLQFGILAGGSNRVDVIHGRCR